MIRVRLLIQVVCGFVVGTALSPRVLAQVLSRVSPFILPIDSPNIALSREIVHVLVGIIGTGKQTRLGIFNMQTNKSVWVPLGGTVDGIEALSCNHLTDVGTVQMGNLKETLRMRVRSSGDAQFTLSNIVFPTASLAQHDPPNPPGGQAEQENEARMLVSDLMEIGMQQLRLTIR